MIEYEKYLRIREALKQVNRVSFDRKLKFKVYKLNIRGEIFEIKHLIDVQKFIISSQNYSFEVQYRTNFKSYVISEETEKVIDEYLLRGSKACYDNILSSHVCRKQLISFLQSIG